MSGEKGNKGPAYCFSFGGWKRGNEVPTEKLGHFEFLKFTKPES